MSCGLVFYYVLQIFLSAFWHTWHMAITPMKNSETLVEILM